MTFIPSELHVVPSKELSRAIASELSEEETEETKKRLEKLVAKALEGGSKDDVEDKFMQTEE